ncbi:MAG: hypothetical protein K2X80_20065 [Pseudomonadaceae bacterium]|nr:hypothetical protein [Pseudomonadaceae bacterium]
MKYKRPVVRSNDFKKFPSIAKVCFAGLSDFDTPDKHKQTDLFARALGYSQGLHEAQAFALSEKLPVAGSITRFDIQYAVAVGLRKLTGLTLDESMRRAIRAPLELLSIDKATAEYAAEVSAQDGDGKLSAASRHRLALKHAYTKDRGKLLEAGAPGYLMAVRKDGKCSEWKELSALFKAMSAAKIDHSIEQLISQSWSPISSRLEQGLRIPLHELVPLFDAEGHYIGQAFRHTVHGGFLPELMVSAEQIQRGKAALLLGTHLPVAVDGAEWLGLDRGGNLPVFQLKEGITPPVPPLNSWDRPSVPTDHLVQLQGITGGYMRSVKANGAGAQDVWSLTAQRKVRPSMDDHSGFKLNCTYLETHSWLTYAELPRLFTGSVVPEQPMRVPGDPFGLKQLTFLPEFALEFHRKATGLLRDEIDQYATLPDFLAAGKQAQINFVKMGKFEEIEQFAKAALHATKDSEAVPIQSALEANQTTFSDDHPLIQMFGQHALWLALEMCCIDFDTARPPANAILSALVLISACAVADIAVPAITGQIRYLALMRWVEGRCQLEELPALAIEFQSYQDKLSAQSKRISDLEMIIDDRAKTLRRAEALGYSFLYGQVLASVA